MARVIIKVVHPTKRADGVALPASEIKNWVLESKANSAPASAWGQLGAANLPSVTERTVDNVPGGKWDFRAKWIDTGDRASQYAAVTVEVETAAPEAGTITATIAAP